MVILLDVEGTLFSLKKIRERFRQAGARDEVVDIWFSAVQQYTMASTLAARYTPFKILAASVLHQIFVRYGISEQWFDPVLQSMNGIEPETDALGCLLSLRAGGHRLIAISSSSGEAGQLLQQWAFRWHFEGLFSADDARVCKAHPGFYELICRTLLVGPYDCCLLSAHARDILAAESVGMHSLYINRLENLWVFPGRHSGITASSLADAPGAIDRQYGREQVLKAG